MDCGEKGKERGPEHEGSPLYAACVHYWDARKQYEAHARTWTEKAKLNER